MAVGIGLVFGVLRLVNFAYGQLIMAGAYTLAFTSDWPTAGSIAACFVVVIALSFAMDRAVFRPLRTQSPAVMLVTTFAVAFLLQNVALILDIRDGTIGEPAVVARAAQPGGHGRRRRRAQGDDPRRRGGGRRARAARSCCSGGRPSACTCAPRRPTSAPRGCSACEPTRVIGVAVLLSGVLAATVAVILTVQSPARLAGLRAQGDDRRPRRRRRRRDRPALDGDARRLRDRVRDGRDQRCAADRQDRLPAVGRVRARDPRPAPAARGSVRPGSRSGGGPRMRRRSTPWWRWPGRCC